MINQKRWQQWGRSGGAEWWRRREKNGGDNGDHFGTVLEWF